MKNHRSLTQKDKPITLLSMLVIMTILLAACAPAASSTATSPDTIDVTSNPTLGKILVTGQGMTLYVFTKDGPDQSNCNAACQANWPFLVSSGTPKLGGGVDASLVGTATLPSGEKIITYNHMPLYTFVKDTQPGQVNGEDVGGVWFSVSPAGKPVQSTGSATSTPAPAASSPEASISIATSAALGQYLVDGKGMTLYVFTKDGPSQSNCTGTCLNKWFPLKTSGQPAIGSGIVADGIGSAALSDGSKVLTYYGMPLYTFSGDTVAGQTNGEGVGGFWFVVAPDGMLLQPPSSATPTPAPTIEAPTPTSANSPAEASISVTSDPKLGMVLVDGRGITLYMFTKDGPDQSNCNAACLANWPPLLTQGHPSLGTGVDSSLVGTAVLADGSKIVTYNHMPLYTFSKDSKPGDENGLGFAGLWYLVSPAGSIVGK